MSDERLIRSRVEGRVARITLARPPLNILTIAMMEELSAAVADVARRPDVAVLVLAAEGKAFSAGVAVEDHAGDRVRPMLAAFHGIFRQLYALECPTVAVVQGAALGGGAELATFCDVVVASETATIGQPEIKVGVFPPIAALHYPVRIGVTRTLQLLLSGRVLPATEAERIGLVDRVVPPGELEAAATEEIGTFLDRSAAIVRLAKRAVRLATADAFETRLGRLEALYLDELMRTTDAAEGLRAFVEKRAPAWAHR